MVVPSQPKSKGVSAVSTSTNTIISTISRANSTIASVKNDSNGCVICAAVAECPDYENNEYCITISLRCSSCLLHILCPQEEQQIKRFLINIASMNGTTGHDFNSVAKDFVSHNSAIHKVQGAIIGSIIGLICIMLAV